MSYVYILNFSCYHVMVHYLGLTNDWHSFAKTIGGLANIMVFLFLEVPIWWTGWCLR